MLLVYQSDFLRLPFASKISKWSRIRALIDNNKKKSELKIKQSTKIGVENHRK